MYVYIRQIFFKRRFLLSTSSYQFELVLELNWTELVSSVLSSGKWPKNWTELNFGNTRENTILLQKLNLLYITLIFQALAPYMLCILSAIRFDLYRYSNIHESTLAKRGPTHLRFFETDAATGRWRWTFWALGSSEKSSLFCSCI